VDVAFIGPNDLTNSMGRPPVFESDDKQFKDAVARVLKTAKQFGVAPGIHVLDAETAQRRIKEGFQFIAITSEAGMMLAKAGEFAKSLGLGPGRTVAKY
jgi:4-hydroxy-2-oxoheptanedioate aldolase